MCEGIPSIPQPIKARRVRPLQAKAGFAGRRIALTGLTRRADSQLWDEWRVVAWRAGQVGARQLPKLIAFAGLPGVGKSTIAREVARRTSAIWLRIDSIEEAIRASGVVPGDLKDAGYRAAYAMAEDNLRLGRDVIGDCVNDWRVARQAWNETGRRAGAAIMWVEVVCSDPGEHRRRVETRTIDVPGLIPPDWPAVSGRDYHRWDQDRLVIDTAGRSVESCVEAVLKAL